MKDCSEAQFAAKLSTGYLMPLHPPRDSQNSAPMIAGMKGKKPHDCGSSTSLSACLKDYTATFIDINSPSNAS